MNINNVPTAGGSYTLEYSFSDGGNSRSVTMSVDSSSSSWLSASVNSSTRLISITVRSNSGNQRTGTITPVVDGSSCTLNTISVSQDGSTPPPPSGVLTCDQLISEFNTVLTSRGYNAVTSSMGAYNYLCTMYNRAVAEYDNGDLMKSSTYSDLEVFNYHGNNTTYAVEAENAMTSWVMAMCLAELVPDKASGSEHVNTQTLLYQKAYNLGGGKSIPIYGNSTDGYYSPKGDVMLARIAASAVYSTNRSAKSSDSGRYTFSDIATFRSELGGHTISDPNLDWKIGFTEAYGNYCEAVAMGGYGTLGYGISSQDIFPTAAGPFITQYYPGGICAAGDEADTSNGRNCNSNWPVNSSRSYPAEQVEKVSASKLFNLTTKNYLVDETIEQTVANNYNLTRANSSNITRTVQAVADAELKSYQYLGNTTYYNYATEADCYYYSFYKVSSQGSSSGSFKGVFNGNVTGKDLTGLIDAKASDGGEAFDEGIGYPAATSNELRKTILLANYGRRRPGEGKVDKTSRHNDGDSKTHDHLEDSTVSALVGGYTYYGDDGTAQHKPVLAYYDANGNGVVDDGESRTSIGNGSNDNCETYYAGGGCGNMRAHTYPSGHSAEIWGITMGMMMMLPDKKTKIYKAGYGATVSRTIVRAHWNSDTLYGKLMATMTVPVMYAITAWRKTNPDPVTGQSKYPNGRNLTEFVKKAKIAIDNAPAYTGGYPFKVKVVNGTSGSVVIGGGSTNGVQVYVCGQQSGGGCHVSIKGTSTSNVTLAAGASYTYEMDGADALACLACSSNCDSGCGGAPGTTKLFFQNYNENGGDTRAVKIYNSNHNSNVLIADPIGCNGSRQEIVRNQTYTVTIKSSDGSGQATCL